MSVQGKPPRRQQKNITMSSSAKGDFFSRMSMQRLTFNQFRKENKVSDNSAYLMFFKSLIGVGMMVFQYAFGRAGSIYGTLLGLVLTYCTGYGLWSLANIASEVEKSKFGLKKMHNYHQLAEYVVEAAAGRKYKTLVGYFVIFFCVIVNSSLMVATILEAGLVMGDYFGTENTFLFKLISVLIICLLTVFCLEPERMKLPTIISAITIFIIDNVIQVLPRNIRSDLTYNTFNLKFTPIFCGIAIMSFEGAGTIFTIRETLANRHKAPRMIALTMIFTGFVVLAFAMSFYFAYGNEDLLIFTYQYYKTNKPILKAAGVIFSLALLAYAPMYNIATSEFLENFMIFSKFINLKNGEKNRSNLLIYRWILIILTSLLALASNKVEIFFNILTMFALPFIGYYLPILFNFMYAKVSRKPRGWLWTIHDIAILLVAVFAQLFGIYYIIKVQLIDGKEQEIII